MTRPPAPEGPTTPAGAGEGAPPSAGEPVAIVGMAGIFPGARDVAQFWRNILDGVDAVDDAPADWDGAAYLDPDSHANDRVYTARGGFLRELARFDPLRHGVMPSSIDGGEPDQFLALEVAADAVADAGFDVRPVPGDRVAVILGRGTYINRGFTTVVQHGVMIDRMVEILRRLHPGTPAEELAEVKRALKASLPPFNAEMAPALVPNLVTGRISNRLDFRGANYIIDAACASSLIALERGVADLRAGRCDMALVGGVHASTPAPIYQIFCQLEALSRRGSIRPFSAEADGTLLAEGVGMLCLKRLSAAEAAGDRIYALVRAVGVASDGRGAGILAPRQEGEMLALRRAYDEAGVAPETVGLIEAHGTATAVGDATEIAALGALMGPRAGAPHCALGAVKSMIGHCLPASGAAGLIKAALALHHRVLPPTLVETPNPALGIEGTPLYLNTEARPWIHGAAPPRRAGVNAFGFGGINAHAVLEEYRGPHRPAAAHGASRPDAPGPDPALTRPSEALLLDAADPEALAAAAADLAERLRAAPEALPSLARTLAAGLGRAPCRLGVVAGSAEAAAGLLDQAAERLRAGRTRLRDRRGLYFGTEPLALAGGKLAFVFPGEGSQHPGMLRELMLHRPEMRRWFDIVDGAFAGHARGLLPSQAIFPPPAEPAAAEALWRMDIGPEAIFAANQAVAALLDRLGLAPDMLTGHSTGEYSALYAAGCTRRAEVDQLQAEMRALNALYEEMAEGGQIAPGRLIALGAVDGAALEAQLSGVEGLFLAMDNCPNQKVLAATTPEAEAAADRIAAALGGFAEPLAFARAYHSPAFAPFAERLRRFLGTLPMAPPERPVYSCLTAAPFPDAPDAIRDLAAAQWSGQVRFAETVARMHDDGARIFVECGPRNNLTAFVNDILRARPHLAVAVDSAGRTGLVQLHHMVAQLAVEGICPDPDGFCAPEPPEPPAGATRRRPQVLKMGLQPMALPQGFPPAGPRPAPARDGSPAPAAGRPRPGPEPDPVPAGTPGDVGPGTGAPAPAGPMATPAASAVPGPAPRPATAPAPACGPLEDPAARPAPATAMDAYFDTMERFMAAERDILGAYFGRRAPAGAQISPDTAPALIPGPGPAPATARADAPAPAVLAPHPAAAAPAARPGRFVMLGPILRAADGQSLTARLDIDLDGAPYLADHGFGRRISAADPELAGLSVMPLTFSMEALAEAAAALCPDLVVTGMEEVRASRWLALDAGRLALEATAERRPSAAAQGQAEPGQPQTRVRVRLRAAEGPALRPILIEAEVLLAPARAPAPPAPPFDPGRRRPAHWDLDAVYGRIMFHGPRLQAVACMDVAGEAGAEGVLSGLAHDALFAATPDPVFETDAITLDAVGQLVGVWSAEMLPEAFHIFPFRVERLEIFRDRLAPGETARCRARIALVGTDEMRSDIDVVTADGRLQCRIAGWWDKRFDLPDRFFRARLDPAANPVSQPLALSDTPGLGLALLADLPDDFLDGSGGIWARVLAWLTLSRAERADWGALAAAAPRRRHDWLRGRVAAKDALRALGSAGAPRFPADLVVASEAASGRPLLAAGWTGPGAAPHLSISHSAGVALAAAADPVRHAGVGVDIERAAPRDGAFLDTAFAPAERARLAAAPEGPARDLLAARFWAAREALGKAFGLGIAEILGRFEVEEAPDPAADPVRGATLSLRDRQSGALHPVRLLTPQDLPGLPSGLVAALALRPL